MEPPQTRYAAIGDADVAYQVVGDRPTDILYFGGLGNHIELVWDYPPFAAALARLASLGRLIFFDRRGTGASDGVSRSAIPTWEEWAEDVDAVLDAAGSAKAVVLATLDGGPISILYAAMRPERVRSLVLSNTSARYLVADDYPVGVSLEVADAVVGMLGTLWGTPELVAGVFPGMEQDPEQVRWATKALRAAATPRTAMAQYRYIFESLDVRNALPLVQAPTVVLHYRENPVVPVEQGRYLADHIAGAKFVELPGASVDLPPDGMHPLIDEVAELLTGERPPVEIDRILTTVLFTDICGSTEQAAALGDQRWRVLLDAHDRAVREQLRRYRGREIKTTGDGFVASFDGPARAIHCAQAIVEVTAGAGIEVRAGLHTGECEVRGDDLGGLAVHIAARVGALAGAGEVLVSRTVVDLVVGSGIGFDDAGEHELRGVPGSWRLFAVNA